MLTDLKTIDTILKMEVLDNRAFVLNEIANYIYKKISENKVPKLQLGEQLLRLKQAQE